ncbi:hypothetical protein E2320_007004, partial [Naja naja]
CNISIYLHGSIPVYVLEEGYHHTSPSGQLPEEQEKLFCSLYTMVDIYRAY